MEILVIVPAIAFITVLIPTYHLGGRRRDPITQELRSLALPRTLGFTALTLILFCLCYSAVLSSSGPEATYEISTEVEILVSVISYLVYIFAVRFLMRVFFGKLVTAEDKKNHNILFAVYILLPLLTLLTRFF